MHGRAAITALLLATSAQLSAQEISCSNQAAEIRCAAGSCEVATESFTPMSLSISRRRLSICAYSGCWEGRVLAYGRHGEVEFFHARPRNSQAGSTANRALDGLAVIYDRASNTAQMRWGGFANAMGCGT